MTLVLLPGLMCDARIFRGQMEAFPDAIAVPGYGLDNNFRSMALRVLDIAPPRFALLGHSMGARVALEIVHLEPGRVDRLALVSTGIHGVRPGEAEKRHALRDVGRIDGIEALVDTWLPPMIAPMNRHNETLVAWLRKMCIDARLPVYEAQIEALLGRPEVESRLPGISCPTLVITGSQDLWSPPEQHCQIADAIPNATLQVVEGAGHMLPAENPEALNKAIADWLSGAC